MKNFLTIFAAFVLGVFAVGVTGATYITNGGGGNDEVDQRIDEETGQVRILAGDTEVEVEFVNVYDDLPVVVLTPMNSLLDNLDYVVKDVSNFGFTVEVDHSYLADVDFSWHAFEVEDGLSYASDGTVEEIEVLVVAAEEAEDVAGEAGEADEGRGGDEEGAEDEEPVDEEPPVEEPPAEEPPVEEPPAEEPPVEEPPVEEPPVEEPPAEEPPVEEPPAEEPPVEEPPVEEPPVEEPPAEEPPAEEPPADDPPVENPPVE